MDCFIFSCNRAMQLQNLLTSIEKNAPNLFDQVTVLYNTRDERETLSAEFEKGYTLLKSRFPQVVYMKETDFRQNLLDYLATSKFQYTCMLVDDAIFYRLIPNDAKSKIINAFDDTPLVSFILGVGKNTVWSMTAGIDFSFPDRAVEKDSVYYYNWKNNAKKMSEFACSFMVVGNIFDTRMLYNYSNQLDFKRPNSYEGKLQGFIQQFFVDELPDHCACFEASSVLHSANNIVQTEHNWHIPPSEGSADNLNKLYLDGYTIQLDRLDFGQVNGLHKNIVLILQC